MQAEPYMQAVDILYSYTEYENIECKNTVTK